MTDAKPNIKRRTLVRGAAWTVPVVSVAAIAPRAAASSTVVCIPGEQICGEYSGSACKHPGVGQSGSSYHFTFCFTNTGGADATVTFTELVINGQSAPAPGATPPRAIVPSSVVVPGDGLEHCFYVDGTGFTTSEQAVGSLTFSVNGVTADVPISAATTPPCGTGADPGRNPGDDPPHSPTGPCGVTGTAPC